MRKYLAVFFVLIAIPVVAQQQAPDPAFLQQVLAAIQGQRNAAADAAASCQAQSVIEIAKLRERIAELEKSK